MSVPMAIIDEKLIKSLTHALIHSGDPDAECSMDIYNDRFTLTLKAKLPAKFRDKYLRRLKTSDADLANGQVADAKSTSDGSSDIS